MKSKLEFWTAFLAIACIAIACSTYKEKKEMVVIAHRGASGYLPEHTLPAKALAYGMQPDYLEQDVVLTKDDIPVVIHDIHLETTTNVADVYPKRHREDGRFYVIDFTWEELAKLAVVERFDAETKQAVYPNRFPLHKSVFHLHRLGDEIEMIQGLNKSMNRNVGIYVEIKEPHFHRNHGKDISRIVLDELAKYGYHSSDSNCILQCFDAVELQKIREEYQSDLFLVQLLEIGYLDAPFKGKSTEEIVKEVSYYADGIGPWYKQIISGKDKVDLKDFDKIVDIAHQYNLKVHAFTFRADDLGDFSSFKALLEKASELQLDGIFTDHPDKVVDFVKGKKD
ncbi:glycerophosphodiester phosphodiesterase [Wenyingzhuangia sp. IMCC45574]